MKYLAFKMNKQLRCYNDQCGKVLPKQSNLNVCKGCKSVYYCDRKCQKYDWTQNHRNECISATAAKLTRKEKTALKRATLLLEQLL